MPLDPRTMPFQRTPSFQRDGSGSGLMQQAMAEDTGLKIDNLLLEEFNYASTTAYQAFDDRARIFNLYLIVVGVLASGLGAAYQLSGDIRVFVLPLAVVVLFIAGVLGTAFFLALVGLSHAHRESLVCMNTVKEYYIRHFKTQLADIDDAFRWRMKTIPNRERFGSVTFVVCHTVALLSSLCYAASVGIAVKIWLLNWDGFPRNLPSQIQPWVSRDGPVPYIVVAILFLAIFLRHVFYFRSQTTPKDAKSRLRELVQKKLGVTPRYQLVSKEGSSHNRRFVADVLVGEHVAARGEGRSKQQAEQAAADRALEDPSWIEARAETGG